MPHVGALLLLFHPRLARVAPLLEMLLRYRFAWLIAVIPGADLAQLFGRARIVSF